MLAPNHYTHMWFFTKLLPEFWKHINVLNFFVCSTITISPFTGTKPDLPRLEWKNSSDLTSKPH